MPAWVAPVIAGAASVGGSIISNISNARQAKDQMKFQKEMSDTAHQREVRDLILAGLNPILSANNGASTPPGAQATMENVISKGVTSAMEVRSMQLQAQKQEKEIGLLDAQTNKTRTENEVLKKDIPKSEMINELYNIARPFVKKISNASKSNAKQPPKTYHQGDNVPVYIKGKR